MLPEDAEQGLADWIAAEVEPTTTAVAVTRMGGGHSSGAWRLDVTSDGDVGPLLLKAPGEPSPVFRRDAAREGRILRDAGAAGAPVPRVVAIDEGGRALGRPCFVMEFVEGWAPADPQAGSYHCDPVLLGSSPVEQRAVWESFHDALAAVHRVDPALVPDAALGPDGMGSVFDYWRASLVDVLPEASARRQLELLEWLRQYLPAGAAESPAVCMGDSRLVNCIVGGTAVQALFDFEIAYLGDPAADVGYSLFLDRMGRGNVEQPLVGIPSEDETWARWEAATGRTVPAADRAYWKAFGAMILAITASRFMAQHGFPVDQIDTDNSVASLWHVMVEEATG